MSPEATHFFSHFLFSQKKRRKKKEKKKKKEDRNVFLRRRLALVPRPLCSRLGHPNLLEKNLYGRKKYW